MLREYRRYPAAATMAFLESLQQAACGGQDGVTASLPITPEAIRAVYPDVTSEQAAEMSTFVSEVDSEIRKATRFEQPYWHLYLQAIVAQIDGQFARLQRGNALRGLPVAGLINTGTVNARTIRVPNTGDHLILVEEELFTFSLLFSRAVAMALPMEKVGPNEDAWLSYSTTIDEIRAHLRVHPDAVKRFSDAVLAYSTTGRASQASPYPIGYESAPLALKLDSATVSFVIAHEYVHVIYGHLKDPLHEKSNTGSDAIAPTVWSMYQEGLADRTGIELVSRVMQGASGHDPDFALWDGKYCQLSPYYAYWGAELFLHCNEIMIKAIALLRTGNEQGMHEHERYQYELFRLRRQGLEVGFSALVKKGYEDAGRAGFEDDWKTISKGLHAVGDVLCELWRRTLPLIKLSHTLGVRPSASWET
jgi:hypothetical protein